MASGDAPPSPRGATAPARSPKATVAVEKADGDGWEIAISPTVPLAPSPNVKRVEVLEPRQPFGGKKLPLNLGETMLAESEPAPAHTGSASAALPAPARSPHTDPAPVLAEEPASAASVTELAVATPASPPVPLPPPAPPRASLAIASLADTAREEAQDAPAAAAPADMPAGPAPVADRPASLAAIQAAERPWDGLTAYASRSPASLMPVAPQARPVAPRAAGDVAGVPLPPDPPERERPVDLTGLLDGGLPESTGPASQMKVVDETGAHAIDAETTGEIQVASLGPDLALPTIKRSWSVSGWTSPLSGARDMTLTRSAERIDDGPVALLSFSCNDATGSVRVTWPRGAGKETVTASLAFDGTVDDASSWSITADGRTMIRNGRDTAYAMARRVAAADNVTVWLDDGSDARWFAQFTTDGLRPNLEDFKAACTS